MPHFQNQPPQCLTYLEISGEEGRQYMELTTNKSNEGYLKQIGIGRTNDNTIQILNNTISKKHAKITLINDKHNLVDLQSVNGTLVNGTKLAKNSSHVLIDNDQIQFGKYEILYKYRDLRRNTTKSKTKSRINLKDYVFNQPQQQSRGELPKNPSNPSKPPHKKIKEEKIKIPDITDYLKLDFQPGKHELPESQKDQQIENKTFIRAPGKSRPREGKIKLTSMNGNDFLTQEDQQRYKISQREKNVYLQQQEAKRQLEEKQRAIKQHEIMMEVERAKISQDLLQKQLLLSEKARQEQEQLNRQREKLEQQFLAKEKQKRDKEMQRIQQLQHKEQQMMNKIENERRQQLVDLEEKQMKFKQESEMQYKAEYERKKQQLEMEAAALAQNYEKIYRETIRKVRTQIDNQEENISKMEEKEEKLAKDNQCLELEIQAMKQQIQMHKQQFITIHGRNKACVLYASELQNKIDAFQNPLINKNDGYYRPSNINKAGTLAKLKDSILNSRRLLKIKSKQYQALNQELVLMKGQLRSENSSSRYFNEVYDYIDTIVNNMEQIQRLKQQYLEYIESQKAVETVWDVEVEQFNQYFDRNRALEAQIDKNGRQIDENVREQIKKSTEQRLHLLKVLHFSSEQKKNAAKFLIEQMLGIQQEVHNYLIQNEQFHQKTVKTISQSEKTKRQNQLYAQMLFGQDQNGHHFDNMKLIINNLISSLRHEQMAANVLTSIKLTQEGTKIQLAIQNQLQRKKQIQQNLRKISQLGISGQQIKNQQKNPLIFFGDLLTQKQLDIDRKRSKINQIENQNQNIQEQLRLLQQKKAKISENLQRFKREQLREAKKYLAQ